MCSDKGAVHVVRCVLLLKAVCFGGFERDPAALVIGLDQLKITLAARDDDNLRQTERSCQPSGRRHIVGLDAQAHQVNTFLRDKQARPDQQETDELACVQLLSPALFLCHQIMPIFCAKRYRTVTSCSRVIMSCIARTIWTVYSAVVESDVLWSLCSVCCPLALA